MTGKERKKLHNKGIFTLNQLAYTFRPRRRPKQLRNTREKYHNSLKALAIRENKINIAGNPELKIDGTPVYVDVEGLPDRDFYYLIGVRIGVGNSAVQHSLWADAVEDEEQIWRKFLTILESVEKPVLLHYGSYETEFFRVATKRYGASAQEILERKGSQSCVNVLSEIYGQVYFPTRSNGLKEIATWLGFAWTPDAPVGANSVAVRHEWERSRHPDLKDRLVAYNVEDCLALEVVTEALRQLRLPDPWTKSAKEPTDVVYVESLKNPDRKIAKFVSPFKEFERLALAAWWNYQRDRIYVKSTSLPKNSKGRSMRVRIGARKLAKFNKVITYPDLTSCPSCGGSHITRTGNTCTRTLYDMHFSSSSMKRWVAKCRYRHYWCADCEKKIGEPSAFWPQSHIGRNLVAYVLYEAVDLLIPFVTVHKKLRRFFKLDVPVHTLYSIKKSAGKQYKPTFERILARLVAGDLLHADETQVSIRGKNAYVWVFTNLREVAYWYAQNREGSFLQEMLKDFNGVLVSDFYGAYDSINCPQQKCLVHLIRDLNDEVLAHPYDEELKGITKAFASLLKPIVDTVDRMGLKRRFLRKHEVDINRFYRELSKLDCRSERATKCKQRLERNRNKLFTFLNYNGVPWNNNNAEHAIRSFAQLRDIVRGSFTEASVHNYLILLSIRQTCKYSGLDFFDFIRSGEKDIHTFEESLRSRRRPDGIQKHLRPEGSGEKAAFIT
jgi:transposase